MIRKAGLFLLCLFLASLLPHAAFCGEEGWELKKDDKGVLVYTRPLEGSELLEFRAQTLVEAPMETVSAVLEDIENYPEWMAKCEKTSIIEDLGGFNYRLLFIQSIGWPVADRFVVLRVDTKRDIPAGTITVRMAADKGNEPPGQEDRVRMGDFEGEILLEYVERDKTRMTFTLHADPGGSLPVRAVNGGTLPIPYKTLLGMKKATSTAKYRKAGEASPLRAQIDEYAKGRARCKNE